MNAKSRVKTLAAVAVASVGIAGAAVPVATGGQTVETKVSFKFNNDSHKFSGKVESSKRKCERNRLVSVYRTNNGQKILLGTDKTDSGGKFTEAPQGVLHGGDPHFAVAEEKVVDGVVCEKDKSPSVIPNEAE